MIVIFSFGFLLISPVLATPEAEAKPGAEPQQEHIKKNEKRQLVLNAGRNPLQPQFGVYDQLIPNNLGGVFDPRTLVRPNFDVFRQDGRHEVTTSSGPITVLGNTFGRDQRFPINFPGSNAGGFPLGGGVGGIAGDPTIVLVQLPDGRLAYYRAPFLFGGNIGNQYPYDIYNNPYYPYNIGLGGAGVGVGLPGGFVNRGFTNNRGFDIFGNNNQGFIDPNQLPNRGITFANRAGGFNPNRIRGSITPLDDRKRSIIEDDN